jgi:hypothetical protein
VPVRKRIIVVNDRMQNDYRYELTEPIGQNFAPEFKPELTPKQLLSMGVFGGKYMTDCTAEFPGDWFSDAKLSPERHEPSLNYFGVSAGQTLSVWRAKGWIQPDDPRGWFQWYCRYYFGRRLPGEDAHQIGRWRAIRRHVRQIERHCHPCDLSCRPRQRQALLQWAYDSRAI